MLKVFIENIVSKLNKIKIKKKAKSISRFDFTTYVTILYKLKFHPKLWVLPWNKKFEVALDFQKHQSTGGQKLVEEDTSQDNFWLMPSHFSPQNVIVPLEN